MDLNTLLSFNEDLTDIEIENFVNELDKVVQEQDYQTAFRMAIDKIHEYPTCDRLIYSAILYDRQRRTISDPLSTAGTISRCRKNLGASCH